jgi:protein-S-isoprenylcysteine O-methyltransferase Ste14
MRVVRRARAAAGSIVFLVVAPGVVAGLGPWLIAGWDGHPAWQLRAAGVVLVAASAAVLLHAFAHFVLEGIGTPAPVAPTERLVVGGLYRYVRNPMYVAVTATILGQALLFGRVVLVGYAVAFAAVVAAFARFYEEPTLRRQFGAEYEAYRRAVPGWRPRLTAFAPPPDEPPARTDSPRSP